MNCLSVSKDNLIKNWLEEVNSDLEGVMGHRNLILQCSDGSLSWNALFLAPLVSRSVWEAVSSNMMGTENCCSQCEAVVQFHLPDYSTKTVKCFLELITTGVVETVGTGRNSGTRKELEDLLLHMCGDLKQFSEFAPVPPPSCGEMPEEVLVLIDHDEAEVKPTSRAAELAKVGKKKRSLPTNVSFAKGKPPKHKKKITKSHEPTSIFEGFPCPLCPNLRLKPGFLFLHLCRTHYGEDLRQKYPVASLKRASSGPAEKKYVCPECGVWKNYWHMLDHLGAKHDRVLQFLPEGARSSIRMPRRPFRLAQAVGCPICATPVALRSSMKAHLCEAHAWDGMRRAVESAVHTPSGFMCPCCGRCMLTMDKLVMHYGVEHDKFIDFVPQKFKGKIARLCKMKTAGPTTDRNCADERAAISLYKK